MGSSSPPAVLPFERMTQVWHPLSLSTRGNSGNFLLPTNCATTSDFSFQTFSSSSLPRFFFSFLPPFFPRALSPPKPFLHLLLSQAFSSSTPPRRPTRQRMRRRR